MIRLKSLTLKQNIVQSPMAGCTDLAFRLLARSYGMEFAFLEMVSANGLVNNNRKTAELLKSTPQDRPLGAQLVGCDPDVMGEAASMIEAMGFDLLDINFGCPVPKIVSPGAGSALLTQPEKAKNIFEKVVRSIQRIPVTVKMRLGYRDGSGAEAVRIAKIAEDAGLCAVAVHGRTREQGYSGTADWNAIGLVKKSVGIPVFGNGDITSGEDAKKLMQISGCDGVMIGRGALGNPWIYDSIHRVCNQGGVTHTPTLEDRKQALLRHLDLELQFEGEKIGVLKMRRIACWYLKGESGVREFREKINRVTSAEELRLLISGFGP